MSSYYKMDPSAWDFGTAELTLEQEAAYLRIVNAINKHDAPVPCNDRVLAGMFRCSTRKARALLDALVEAGKVSIVDGKITNFRACSEVVQRQLTSISHAERGAKGGRTKAEQANKSLENNEQDLAIASPRIEYNIIKKEEAKASSKKSASRISQDWVLSRDLGEWAVAEGLSESEVRLEAEKFRDYWLGKSGQGGTKADWAATWRNWVRRAVSDRAARSAQHGVGSSGSDRDRRNAFLSKLAGQGRGAA